MRLASRTAMLVALPAAIAACGGGSTGPSNGIATITVSGSTSFTVGDVRQLSASAHTASGGVVSGVTFVWTSSDTAIAKVNSSGGVTATAAGNATITAAAQGKSGTLGVTVAEVAVATVDVSPLSPTIGVGGTIVLTAVARDGSGKPITKSITWASSDPGKVSISATSGTTIVATGVALATGITVTATAGGQQGVATFNVAAGTSPVVTSTTPSPLVAGSSGTINGTGFSATPGNNTVTVDGITATVTASSATQITITVADGGFACTDTRDAPVLVTVGGLSGSKALPFDPAKTVSLTVGQSQFFDASPAAGSCIKLPMQSSANYVISVSDQSPNTPASFKLSGLAAADILPAMVPAPARAAPRLPRDDSWMPWAAQDAALARAQQAAHIRMLDRNTRIFAARGGPHGVHAQLARRRRISECCGFNPQVGDTVSLHIDDIDHDNDCTVGFLQRARVVYVSAKTIVFDDLSNPLFGQTNAEMQAMGAEFDNVTLPVETGYFGDPLALDPTLGNNGHVFIFFTQKVNTFQGGGIAGFVNSCDFFPYDVGSDPATRDTVSNEAPIFYAYVPTSLSGTGSTSVTGWHAFVRSVLPHETKHIVSYAERIANNADGFEENWLEESTAQTASEIYGRTYEGNTWKGHAEYPTTLHCEWTNNFCGGDHPLVMLHHYGYLYDYLSNFQNESPVASSGGEVFYGGAWSFVRWSVDQYASDEATTLKAIVQSLHQFGMDNLSARTGAPPGVLTSRFAMASAVAPFPVAQADPLLTFPSWNQSGIFGGLHTDSPSGFPLVYPLVPVTVTFGPFSATGSIKAGGANAILLTGGQTSNQVIALTTTGGAALDPSSPIRLAIARVQ